MAERARSKAKEKVERMTRSNSGRIDASGWKEPTGEKAEVQTGPRPISRRQFKRGGKVHGEKPAMHAGRKPRAKGGALTATSLINRDVKTANESRDGEKHVGGMKKGGKVHGRDCKCCGGGAFAEGGKVKSEFAANHAMAAAKGQPAKGGTDYFAHVARSGTGSRTVPMPKPRKAGGSVTDGSLEGARPEGGRLARKHGGSAKKGTNINIIIAPGGGGPKPMPMGPPPGMPPGGPVGLHQGAPPPGMPPGAAPPAMGPPPQMRKRGGRAYPIESGAGGGLGRLEKARAYG